MSISTLLAGGGLATPAAHLAEDEARLIALERYGLTGEFKRFATEKDDTFRIEVTADEAFILKIANPAEQALEVDFQTDLLRHLELHAPSLSVPRMKADREGNWRSTHRASDGTDRFVRLVSYIEGTPLDSTSSSAKEREQVGRVLARLRLAMANFNHLGETRELAWNIQHLAELAPLLDEVDDEDKNHALSAGLERFLAATEKLGSLRRQVLHNDFSRSNIVVDHDAPEFVKGIIDFGDAVQTAIAIDVSTALLNQLPRTPQEDPFAAGRDLLRGYLSLADLTDDELAMIPHLTMGRVIARALLSIWRARMFPQNADYILRNTQQGWWQLEWFLGRSKNELSEILLQPARL